MNCGISAVPISGRHCNLSRSRSGATDGLFPDTDVIIPLGTILLAFESISQYDPDREMNRAKASLSEPAELGAVIRARRKTVGLTQRELADAAGTSLRLVSEVERGKANARLESVLKLLAELGLELYVRPR